jgi:hypothetical protein
MIPAHQLINRSTWFSEKNNKSKRMTQRLAPFFSIESGAGMLILLPSASKWLARHANVSPVSIPDTNTAQATDLELSPP